jgi:phosphoenolpyruvate synthase/pyruvate phosphate dikinase
VLTDEEILVLARWACAIEDHYVYDLRLKFLFEQIIDKVNDMTNSDIDALNRQLPFSKG